MAPRPHGRHVRLLVSEISGSVEAACGLGLADAVVDLVETGTTMRAAGLEIVDTARFAIHSVTSAPI